MLNTTKELKTCLFILFIFGSFFSVVHAQIKMVVEVFPLGLSDFESSEAIAKEIVSPDSKLVADKKGNRLIVLDYPEKLQLLRNALNKAPRPGANVRIKISFVETATAQSNSAGLGDPNKKGSSNIEAKIQEFNENKDSFVEQELMVVSGGKAHFRVGTNLPYATWIFNYGVENHFWSGAIQWREVGAQMIIEPYVLDNKRIRLRLTPELSYIADEKNQTVVLEQLTTEIFLSNEEEMQLSGIATSHKEFYDKFLMGYTRIGERRSVQIRLKPTIVEFVDN
jgi:type II secretory pathway component GspD/PulD (secretin)